MKSNRLSFNAAIARNTLRRCWPLWAAYLGFLLVTFPLPLLSEIRTAGGRNGVSLLYVCREQIANMAVFQGMAGMAVEILTQKDSDVRMQESIDLQKYLAEECPQVPLYVANLVIAYNKNLKGERLFGGGNHDWSHAYIAK